MHEWHEKRDSDKKDLSDSDRWRVADSVICYFIVHGRTGGTESGKYWGRIYFRKYCDLPSVLDDGVYAGSK